MIQEVHIAYVQNVLRIVKSGERATVSHFLFFFFTSPVTSNYFCDEEIPKQN